MESVGSAGDEYNFFTTPREFIPNLS